MRMLRDKPLNNLDIAASRSLMAQLHELATSQGRTVFIVLHDITYAAAYADRILALRNGTLVADGSPNAIVTKELLNDVFHSDAKIAVINDRPVLLV